VDLSGAIDFSGTGYAEMFEWADGNPAGEDRRGLFVTPQEGNIRIANDSDDYILGVVAAAPAYIGGAYEPDWPYVPRVMQMEWAAVGMLGRLAARDDGSCVPGGFCGPNACGMAAAGAQGYRVLHRIGEDMVLICLK